MEGGGDQLKAKSETNLYPDSRDGPPHHPATQPQPPYYPAHSVPNLDQGPRYGQADPSIMRHYEPHGRARYTPFCVFIIVVILVGVSVFIQNQDYW